MFPIDEHEQIYENTKMKELRIGTVCRLKLGHKWPPLEIHYTASILQKSEKKNICIIGNSKQLIEPKQEQNDSTTNQSEQIRRISNI